MLLVTGLVLELCVGSCKPHANAIITAQSDSTEKSLVAPLDRTLPIAQSQSKDDSTVLYKMSYLDDYGLRHYQKVYIERQDWHSSNYERMLTYPSFETFDEDDWRGYNEWFSQLKKKFPEPLPKVSLDDCPQAWIPLCCYKGKYYIHELKARYPFWLNDSLHIERNMDGAYPSKINSFEKLSKTHYHAQLESIDYCEDFDLYWVDLAKKVAVVHYGNRYSLHVARETAHLFDMIAWDFQEMPDGDEVEMDSVDFEKLIGGCE